MYKSKNIPGVENHSTQVRVGYLSFIAAFILFFGISYVLRFVLRVLFSWQGWLHRGASKRCPTKCWAVAVRLLTGRDCFPGKALTYSYQGALPSLPVPNLATTVQKYIDSVEPLLSVEDFEETERLASEFLTGNGPNLNRYLTLKAWFWSSNYVTEWWEKYVYLRGRSSLMINSNYYIMDFADYVPTTRQAARAAGMARLMCDFCRLLDQEKIEPMRVRGLAPLCMAQYERMFATTRQPGRDSDFLYHRTRARHIAVLCAGHWYRVDVVRVPSGNSVEAHELERQFFAIQADAQRLNRTMSTGLGGGGNHSVGGVGGAAGMGMGASMSAGAGASGGGLSKMRRSRSTPMELGEAMKRDKNAHGGMYEKLATRQISALTALPRDLWAKAKEEHLSEGVNRISVREIERSLFVVVLDQGKHATLSERGKSLLHGNGTNRWFDKSLQLIVYTDGHCGMNCEHSWADAPVSGHLWEYCLCHEVAGSSIYGGDGHLRGYKHESPKGSTTAADNGSMDDDFQPISPSKSARKKFLQPQRLRFQLTSSASSVVRDAAASAHQAMADLDLHVFGYDEFGKREIKGFQISPDAFLQMALQLAYYRDSNGTLALTYEASMVRLFKHGRTETVRSLTKESSAFVKAMFNANLESEKIRSKLIELLRVACSRHQKSYIDAMTGNGIDRHLFALVRCSIVCCLLFVVVVKIV